MKILQSTIKEHAWQDGAFWTLKGRMSTDCAVSLTIRSFNFQPTMQDDLTFTLAELRILFSDLLPSADKKIDNESCQIAGFIEKIPYDESLAIIDHFIFCGGLAGDLSASRDDVPEKLRGLAQENLALFWSEVKKFFTLPPTHVYMHEAAYGTFFAEGSVWNFCYIYLNDITKQGIVLAYSLGW